MFCHPVSPDPVVTLYRYTVCRFGREQARQAGYQLYAGGTGQLIYALRIGGRHVYLVEERQQGRRWRVGVVARDDHLYNAPAA